MEGLDDEKGGIRRGEEVFDAGIRHEGGQVGGAMKAWAHKEGKVDRKVESVVGKERSRQKWSDGAAQDGRGFFVERKAMKVGTKVVEQMGILSEVGNAEVCEEFGVTGEFENEIKMGRGQAEQLLGRNLE